MTLKQLWIVAYATFLVTESTSSLKDVYDELLRKAGKNPTLISKFRSLHFAMKMQSRVSVKVSMSFRKVVQLHEQEQVMTSSVLMSYFWRDVAYAWDPHNHNGIEEIFVPRELVRLPDIQLYNSVRRNTVPTTKALELSIRYTGDIIYHIPAVFRTTCTIDANNYPFDQHTCEMVFGSLLLDNRSLDIGMTTNEPPTDVHNYR